MKIKVKVFPESKQNKIIKKNKDEFQLYVREKAEMGQANKAVIEFLAAYFNISLSNIRLIKGFHQRNKIFEIKI